MLKNKAVLAHVLVWTVLLAVLWLVNVRDHAKDAAIIIVF